MASSNLDSQVNRAMPVSGPQPSENGDLDVMPAMSLREMSMLTLQNADPDTDPAASDPPAQTQKLYRMLAFSDHSSDLKKAIMNHEIFNEAEHVCLPISRCYSQEMTFHTSPVLAIQNSFHSTVRQLGKSLSIGADHAFVQEDGQARNKKMQNHLLRFAGDSLLDEESRCAAMKSEWNTQDVIMLTVCVPTKDLWTAKAFPFRGPWTTDSTLSRTNGKLLHNCYTYSSTVQLPVDQLHLVKASMEFTWDSKESTDNGNSSSGTDFFIPIGEGELAKMILRGDWTLTPQNFCATTLWRDPSPRKSDGAHCPSIPCYLSATQAAMHLHYLQGAINVNAMKPMRGVLPQFNEAQSSRPDESLPEVCGLLQVSIDPQRLISPASGQPYTMRSYSGELKIPFDLVLLDGTLRADSVLGWSVGRGHLSMHTESSATFETVCRFKVRQQRALKMRQLTEEMTSCTETMTSCNNRIQTVKSEMEAAQSGSSTSTSTTRGTKRRLP